MIATVRDPITAWNVRVGLMIPSYNAGEGATWKWMYFRHSPKWVLLGVSRATFYRKLAALQGELAQAKSGDPDPRRPGRSGS